MDVRDRRYPPAAYKPNREGTVEPGKQYRVKAHALNLRSEPKVAEGNRLALLPQGHLVVFVATANANGWWKVSTTVANVNLTGCVDSQFLEAAPSTGGTVPAVHLPNPTSLVARTNKRWAFALNEEDPPTRDGTDPADLTAIVKWLDVQKATHLRYKPTAATFCNIYAYDYCYLAGAYLPRVWWRERALAEWLAGRSVPVRYDATVHELNANMLFAWLAEWGDDFGWRRSFDLDEVQEAANAGHIAVMSGARVNKNESGHITAVVPETGNHAARRNSAKKVIVPLQSQAGRNNMQYHTDDWGLGSKWSDRGCWIHD
jgi:hypothetical protein